MSARQSFYIGVKGVIQRNGLIFVVKDAGRGKWELPGGRIDQGQTIEEAFTRELSEEVPGAKLKSLGDTIYEAIGDFKVENDHALFLTFKLAKVTMPDRIEVSDEHEKCSWVSAENFDNFDFYSTDEHAVRIAMNLK